MCECALLAFLPVSHVALNIEDHQMKMFGNSGTELRYSHLSQLYVVYAKGRMKSKLSTEKDVKG